MCVGEKRSDVYTNQRISAEDPAANAHEDSQKHSPVSVGNGAQGRQMHFHDRPSRIGNKIGLHVVAYITDQ